MLAYTHRYAFTLTPSSLRFSLADDKCACVAEMKNITISLVRMTFAWTEVLAF